jgi:hypothetical protein
MVSNDTVIRMDVVLQSGIGAQQLLSHCPWLGVWLHAYMQSMAHDRLEGECWPPTRSNR